MSHSPRDAENVLAKLACAECKSERQLPICYHCQKSGHNCVYPIKRHRPGPKPGSTGKRYEQPVADESANLLNSASTNNVYTSIASDSIYVELQDEVSHSYSPVTTPSSTGEQISNGTEISALNFARAISLTSLFHPSHEETTSPRTNDEELMGQGTLVGLASAQLKLGKASESLQLTIDQIQGLVDLYFENMTAYSLFNRPSFSNKIRDIEDHDCIIALFAAMFSISSKFITSAHGTLDAPGLSIFTHQQFHNLSIDYINLALYSHSNRPPSISILQAMALASFYKLANGVCAQAWRLIGSAIRVAYEIRLHLIDYDGYDETPNTESKLMRWSLNEERRRCWWALWDMDMFASIIRRSPTAVDWGMNETYLPIPDHQWFANRYQASCTLQGDPNDRWKKLRHSGNQSPVAWYIIISSLMRDAQVLSHGNIQGIFSNLAGPKDNDSKIAEYFSCGFKKKVSAEDTKRLESLVEAYQTMTEALPETLSYRGEVLTFGLNENEDVSQIRQSCAAKYSIHMVTEFTRFMINHHYVFTGLIDGAIPIPFANRVESPGSASSPADVSIHTQALEICLHASDNIAELLRNCADNHVRFVNPFLASTVWLAASLQICRKLFVHDSTPEATQNKYEALRHTYLQFVDFWGTPYSLIQDLDSLETRVALRQIELNSLEEKRKTGLAERRQSFPPMRTTRKDFRRPSTSIVDTGWQYWQHRQKPLTSMNSDIPTSTGILIGPVPEEIPTEVFSPGEIAMWDSQYMDNGLDNEITGAFNMPPEGLPADFSWTLANVTGGAQG